MSYTDETPTKLDARAAWNILAACGVSAPFPHYYDVKMPSRYSLLSWADRMQFKCAQSMKRSRIERFYTKLVKTATPIKREAKSPATKPNRNRYHIPTK